MPAGVCITSLLKNAKPDTFYDIFVLHSSRRLSSQSISKIQNLTQHFKNCDFTYIDLNDAFAGAFEIRNVTVDTYSRLAIPDQIRHYDLVIYSDVDIIFNGDLAELYNEGIGNKSLGAVKLNIRQKHIAQYLQYINLEPSNYYNAGFILMNLSKIRDENSFQQKAFPLLKHNLIYQDQDILNIAFQNDIAPISLEYNYAFRYLLDGIPCKNPIVYHFMAKKPWKDACAFSDIWWDCYKKSIFFDSQFYLDYQERVFRHSNDHKERNIIKRAISLVKMAHTTFGARHVKKV